MRGTLLISAAANLGPRLGQARAALLDAKQNLVAYWGAADDEQGLRGEVFLGRVQQVRPALQAAFVDIGLAQAGMLPLGRPELSQIKVGQQHLVQIARQGKAPKGPRLTTEISLDSPLLVIRVGARGVALSKQIHGPERERLLAMAKGLLSAEHGWILRSAAAQVSELALSEARDALLARVKNLQFQSQQGGQVRRLVAAPPLPERLVLELLPKQVERVVVDDAGIFARLRALVQSSAPQCLQDLSLYERSTGMFQLYNVEAELERALAARVWLKGGGSLVWQQTEALCAVDVNSAGDDSAKDLGRTALQVNLAAVDLIARQLRLRNISGLVVIDFIDMPKSEQGAQVVARLKQALRHDPARCKVLDMSALGLVQLSRQRLGPSLQEQMQEPCPHCHGLGLRGAPKTLACELLAQLSQAAMATEMPRVSLRCAPSLASYLRQSHDQALMAIQQHSQRQLQIIADPKLAWGRCEVVADAEVD